MAPLCSSARTRRWHGEAQIHPLSQFGKRQAAVRLQFSKNFSIDAIHVEDFLIFTVL
jgi:hypothetical protein